MNDVTPFPAASRILPEERDDRPTLFTGRVIEKLAYAETWIVERLKAAQPDENIPHFLGQRVEALRAALRTLPTIANKPVQAEALLERLSAYVDLRATLAHAYPTALHGADGKRAYLFETACLERNRPWKARMILKQDELDHIQRDLSDVVNRLCQLAPKLKPSSPHRPKPGAAAGP